MNRGQLAIVLVFGVSLVAAVSSIWYRYRETRPVLDFWGPAAVRLITHADRVEALEIELLRTDEPDEDALHVDGDVYRIVQVRDVTTAPGWTQARHALTVRRSFQWDPDPTACEPAWQYALRFFEADRTATVLISIDCPLTRLSDSPRVAGIQPIAAGLATVLSEQLQPGDDSQAKQTTSTKN